MNRALPVSPFWLFLCFASYAPALGFENHTVLGVDGSRFTINGQPAFLLGVSYYGAIGAPWEICKRDLDEIKDRGFNWVRIWANWGAFDQEAYAVDVEGNRHDPGMKKLKEIVTYCDQQGLIVDVTLSRGNGVTGPKRLQSLEAHLRAVRALIDTLKEYKNWYIDLSNERNIQDPRFTSIEDLAVLRQEIRSLDPTRLVTASHAGDVPDDVLRDYVVKVGLDFISPHRPRGARSPQETEAKTREYLSKMKNLGRLLPVHYQEPFRRSFGSWQPSSDDFLVDLKGAYQGGAAGWCFHNGDTRNASDGRPRRSFDLREGSLFRQLDAEERKAVELIEQFAKEVIFRK